MKGVSAVWDRPTRTIRCIECPTVQEPADRIDPGAAGGSARREYERRADKRAAALRSRWGDRVGGLIERLTVEPQSTRAWAIGARGEEKLGAALAGVAGIQVLHDRRVPGTRGNIDHIVVAPAGVFVVDAKDWEGVINVRNVGGWLKTDLRLYVGRRDATALAEGLGWQVDPVAAAILASGMDPLPHVTPVLCFVGGSWPLLLPPNEFRGVRLESERSIRKLLVAASELDAEAIDRVARILAAALPAK